MPGADDLHDDPIDVERLVAVLCVYVPVLVTCYGLLSGLQWHALERVGAPRLRRPPSSTRPGFTQ